MQKSRIVNVANSLLNSIRENNILAKYSEYTCTLNHDSISLDVNHWMHFI